uniref:Uncharacterized protein n=1 Tax=Molossus molossus TaxID=27622 RepID=A0A7J8DQI1_MOLMO|nr:hypothetical protein HJG59_009299 [Molossus molossus]
MLFVNGPQFAFQWPPGGVESPREGPLPLPIALGRSKMTTVLCVRNSAKALSTLQIPSVPTQFQSSLPSLCQSPRLTNQTSGLLTGIKPLNQTALCRKARLSLLPISGPIGFTWVSVGSAFGIRSPGLGHLLSLHMGN